MKRKSVRGVLSRAIDDVKSILIQKSAELTEWPVFYVAEDDGKLAVPKEGFIVNWDCSNACRRLYYMAFLRNEGLLLFDEARQNYEVPVLPVYQSRLKDSEPPFIVRVPNWSSKRENSWAYIENGSKIEFELEQLVSQQRKKEKSRRA